MVKNSAKKKQAQAKRSAKRSARSKEMKASKTAENTSKRSILSLLPKHTKKANFPTFAEAIAESWNKTYFIARGRPVGQNQMRIVPLGTGFLCGRQCMLTCAHCIVNTKNEDAMAKHHDGDTYFFVARDGAGRYHSSQLQLKLDSDLFIYQDTDAAIIELPESFYTNGQKVFKHPDDHFLLADDMIGIGSDVGVIGYPFQQLKPNTGQSGIDISGVLVRVDKGVINTAYKDGASQLLKYEFTMSFNPGNSGGPIIRPSDGKVIAWVRGFNSTAMEISGGNGEKAKIYAHYSEGLSTANLKGIAKKHNLAF
ncbi:MAG TPA: serine protease [Candidatus Saccharimonadales bacterium]|nr:serine protease [Candidatus Saccharimonadales bacterium]